MRFKSLEIIVAIVLLQISISSAGEFENARNALNAWAESFGETPAWVENNFVINKNGEAISKGDILLDGRNVHYMPKEIVRIKGHLNLALTPISSIETFPRAIDGALVLMRTKIKSLRGISNIIEGSLDLRFTEIEGLSDLKSVGGSILLTHSKVRTLNGMPREVYGHLYLDNTQITSLEGFPEVVTGNVNISHTQISSLRGLPGELQNGLIVIGTQIKNLVGIPSSVGSHLYLSDNAISDLSGLPNYIGGYLFLENVTAKNMVTGIKIQREIILAPDQKDLAKDAKGKGYRIKISAN